VIQNPNKLVLFMQHDTHIHTTTLERKTGIGKGEGGHSVHLKSRQQHARIGRV